MNRSPDPSCGTPPRDRATSGPADPPEIAEQRSAPPASSSAGAPEASSAAPPELTIDHGRMLELIAVEGQLLTAATHDVAPAAPVAGASGRTAAETVRDLGGLCEDVLSWLGATAETARTWTEPEPDDLPAATHRFTARLAELLAEFGTRPPDSPCPTWWPEQHTARFWIRRVLHATTVHRVDVQTAAGVEVTPIAADVARDGIDEVLQAWLGYRLHALGITSTRPCSVAVSAAGAEWLVHADPQRTVVRRTGEGVADCADGLVGGSPDQVYLWLWGRVPDRAVRTSGDPDAIAQLWGLLRLATR